MSGFFVLVIPMLADNYSYYVFNPAEPNKGTYIDVATAPCLEASRPVIGLPPLKECEKLTILTTHKHWDHAQGNVELPNMHPGILMKVFGSKEDHVPGCNMPLDF